MRVALRPGLGSIALEAEGFRRPRRVRGGTHFTPYEDLIHFHLGPRMLRIGARRGVIRLARSDFRDPAGPVRLVRLLEDRIAELPDAGARIARRADLDDRFESREPLRVTWVAAAACVAVFVLAGVLGPAAVHAGLMSPLLVRAGELWRLLTANAMHWDLTHLFFNTLGLLALGSLTERILGSGRTALVLGVAALGTSFAGIAADYAALLGASGMVAGLAGALLWMELRHPESLPAGWRIPRAWFFCALLADAALPLVVPAIAGWGHAGGFAGGGLAAALWTGRPPGRGPLGRVPRALLSLLAVAAVLAFAAAAPLSLGLASAWERHAERLLDSDEEAEPLLMNDAAWILVTGDEPSPHAVEIALELAERAVAATGREDPHILDTLAEAQFRAGNAAGALETIEEAIQHQPEEPYYREQRRRFLGERDVDDLPPPPRLPGRRLRDPPEDQGENVSPSPATWTRPLNTESSGSLYCASKRGGGRSRVSTSIGTPASVATLPAS